MDLFLVTTHGLKTCLTSQQPTLLIRPATKSSLTDIEYYKIKGKEMLVRVKAHVSMGERLLNTRDTHVVSTPFKGWSFHFVSLGSISCIILKNITK